MKLETKGLSAAALVLIGGCTTVRVVDDDGGRAGTGGDVVAAGGTSDGGTGVGGFGGEGGAPAVPRFIEVDLRAPADFSAASVVVMVNQADGALKQSLSFAELPSEVEVIDGDLVSFLVGAQEAPWLTSYRVTPEVFRIVEVVGPGPADSFCDGEPMQVTATLPPLAGAFDYTIATDNYGHANSMQAGEVVFDVTSCDGDFDLLAYARGGSAIIRYELIEGLPYTPGGTMSLALTVADTERKPVSFDIDQLAFVSTLSLEAQWSHFPSMLPHEAQNQLLVEDPSAPLSWAPAVISPGDGYGFPVVKLHAIFDADGSGQCSHGFMFRFGETDQTIPFLPGRLPEARAAGEASWAFVGEGEAGDVIWQSWDFGESPWTIAEDPARPPLSAVFPVLPADLPPELTWPAARPSSYSIKHEDILERAGYAELIASPPAFAEEPLTRQSRSRLDCD